MKLSIIVPLYNESELIRLTLDRLTGLSLPGFVTFSEIIVVDDCSTDGSFDIVKEYIKTHNGIKLLQNKINMGKGASVRAGALAASGDVLLIQDADLEFDISDIGSLLAVMNENDLPFLSGSRFMTRSHYNINILPTIVVNRLFSKMASLVSGAKITDLCCGYKVIKKELFLELCLMENRFAFETELTMKVTKKTNLPVTEVPVSYKPRLRCEGKKIRIGDSFSIISGILRYGMAGRRWISALTILIAVIIALNSILTEKRWQKEDKVIEWDIISYYAYLPATFIYHDLSLSFKDSYSGPHRFVYWPEKPSDRKYVIKSTMGLSFLYLPFFAVGHAAALITGADAGGYSGPYKIALLLSGVFYLALGLFFLSKLLLEFFSDRITAMVIAGFAFGTNLFWYSTTEAPMPHVYGFALIACFFWNTVKWHERPSFKRSVLIGVIAGLITLIRPTNIIIVLVFILYNVRYNIKWKDKYLIFRANYRYLLLMLCLAILVWLPQMLYWKAMTGHLLFFSYTENERFFFNNPQIINGLFSFRKGLLLYTPLMILAFAGIWYLWRLKSPFALAITIFLPVNVYIIYSWWCWWYGGGFGSRPFIDSYALMALPVAALLQSWVHQKRKTIRLPLIALYFLVVSMGIYYNKLYHTGAIHWDSMTKEAFFDSLGRIHPSPQFNSMLAEPDYELAKMGIQATRQK
jgi:glycosyltransferase involved in cell wall biosynthesis